MNVTLNLYCHKVGANFWSPGGFATTVGYNDLNATIAYIKNQEAHHGVDFA